MGDKKPQPIQTPYQQKNTYGTQSIADTPEAKALLDVDLDFNPDPGVGRRTDLAEQEVGNRWDGAFMNDLPEEYRARLRDSEVRKVRSQGAAEAQEAEFTAKNAKTMADLERRRLLLPQIVQTGGSGYNTQLYQPQPGFGQQLALGAVSGLSGLASKI